MMNFLEFAKNTKQKLSARFKIREEDDLLIGSRTYFSFKGLVILSQHFFIKHQEKVTVTDLKDLFETGFKKAKKINRIPLLRGMQFGYMIIPVIVSKNIPQEVIDYVNSKPRTHFSLFEFPVVYDLATGKVHFYRQTHFWGAFFYSDLREIVGEMIG